MNVLLFSCRLQSEFSKSKFSRLLKSKIIKLFSETSRILRAVQPKTSTNIAPVDLALRVSRASQPDTSIRVTLVYEISMIFILSLPLSSIVLRLAAPLALIVVTLLASESVKFSIAVSLDIVTVSTFTPLRSRDLFVRPEALLKSSDSRFVSCIKAALLISVIFSSTAIFFTEVLSLT